MVTRGLSLFKMLSRSANGIGEDPAGRSTGFCFGKSHGRDLSCGWMEELRGSESKTSWRSGGEQAGEDLRPS